VVPLNRVSGDYQCVRYPTKGDGFASSSGKKSGAVSPAALIVAFEAGLSAGAALCWLWLASDSAGTAIDWRVDGAWLLAASYGPFAFTRATIALIVRSPMVNYHQKGCESAGGHR
jgi:hypothetical protein